VCTTRREWLPFRLPRATPQDGDEFLDHVVRVTGDETCVSFANVETKERSKQWMHTHSPKKPNKFKQTLSARTLMAAVFWVGKGVMMVESMQQWTTITSEVYCETLENCVGPFRTKGLEC
jgi:hypothetical protein